MVIRVMPFGEDLPADSSCRQTNLKYSQNQDDIRQKFTAYERDDEIGLDYAQAGYYNSARGRFT
jgi:hypothetical protein